MKRPLHALRITTVMVAGAGTSIAQGPAITDSKVPAPRTVYMVPPRRTVMRAYPRYQPRTYTTMVRRPLRRRAYTTVQPYPTYSSSGPVRDYRQSINTGQDPNRAAGRGVRLDKPWES